MKCPIGDVQNQKIKSCTVNLILKKDEIAYKSIEHNHYPDCV